MVRNDLLPTPPGTDRSLPVWQSRKHLPEIDGVRGLAILLVTLYRFGISIPATSAAGFTLFHLANLGQRGVDLFFVLSGFLITGILVDSKGDPHFFRNFFVRRALRIFPLYFVSLLFLLIIVPAVAGPQHPFADAMSRQLSLWTYLTNFQMSWEGAWCFGPLDHYWSLAVEEHFYFVWPLVVYAVSRTMGLRLAISLAITSSVARILYVHFSANEVAPDVLTWFRADGLLIGAAIALLIRQPQGLSPYRSILMKVCPILCAAALVEGILHRRLMTVGHTLWPLAWASLLMVLLTSHRSTGLARFFQGTWVRNLGKYSYAMYVVQNPLKPLLGVGCLRLIQSRLGDGLIAHLVYVCVMFSLTYGFALLSWNLLEKHCLRLKDCFTAGGQTAASNAASPIGREANLAAR